MNKIRPTATLACGIAAALALAMPAPAAEPEYRWDMPNAFSRNSSDGVADQVFSELVKEKTGGRIEIIHHFDGSLGYSGVDHLDAVRDGAVPIARQAMSYLGGYDPLFLLSSLPFLMQSLSDVKALHRIALPYWEEAFLKHNQVMISAGLFPPSGLWLRKPIKTLDQLQGLKLRAFDLNSLETFKRAGAAAINLGWSDVMPALSTKAIDGVLTSADLGVKSSLYEFLPVFMEINWTIPFSAVTVNKDTWDALPEELRQALREAGEETAERTIARLATQVEDNYAEMREKGLTVIEDSPEPLLEHLYSAAEPTVEDWKKKAGAQGEAILEAYRTETGRN